MSSSRLQRVVAPNLPPYPELWWDRQRRSAKVILRHATWRSHVAAHRLVTFLGWGAGGGLAWYCYSQLSDYDPMSRCCLTLYTGMIGGTLAAYLMRQTLRGMLARQLFATRLVFFCTPRLVAFRSRRYVRPVVVWRQWRGRAVRARFIIHPDREAQEHAAPWVQQRLRHVVQESRLVEMVLTVAAPQRGGGLTGDTALYRAIAMTEIESRLAVRLTMVLTAAVQLTAEQVMPGGRRPLGSDIEAL